MQTNRNRPSGGTGAVTKPAKVSTAQSNHGADELAVDLALVGGINADLWALLFDGRFKLALRCDTCGRWLTAHKSKAAGRGPSCAARAAK